MTTRVMIIEDHGLLAQSLQLALRADGFEVEISFGATAEEILAAAGRMMPAVVLLDLDLGPGVGSALPLIGPLRELGACVVMVTGEENRTRLGECVEAGAIGIVPKSAPFDHLVESVKEAAGLRTLMSKSERDQLLAEMRRQHADNERQQAVFSGLTPRGGSGRAVRGQVRRCHRPGVLCVRGDGPQPDPLAAAKARCELADRRGRRRPARGLGPAVALARRQPDYLSRVPVF